MTSRAPRLDVRRRDLEPSRRLFLTLAAMGSTIGLVGCDRTSRVAPSQSRVAIAGGALTEIAHDLGVGDRLVGTDTSSTYPDSARSLPKFGYQRQLASEGILSLSPELFLGSDEAGPPEALEQLRSASVRVVIIPNPKTKEAIVQRVKDVGAALELVEPAQRLAADVEQSLAALERAASERKTRPRVLFLYARGQGNLLVGGRNTAADLVLSLVGCTNAASALDGFQALTPESVIGAAPDFVLVPEKGLASIGGADGLFATPGLSDTSGAHDRQASRDPDRRRHRVARGSLLLCPPAEAKPGVSAALVAAGVSLRRGGKTIVADVHVRIEPGRMLAILGPNGAGKSSLMRILSGEHRPDEGTVTLDDVDLASWSLRDIARRRGFLRQRFSVAADISVEELVQLGRMPHADGKGRSPPDLVPSLLEEVGLQGFAQRKLATLSGGEQQRAHLARVLAQLALPEGAPHPPPILLLDEPSASLDPRNQLAVLALAQRRSRAGFGVAVVLHDIDLAVRFADDLLLLQGGTRVWGGPAQDLTSARLETAFGLEAEQWTDASGQRRWAWIDRP